MAFAEMGYFGQVTFDVLPGLDVADSAIRATSIDLNMTQAVTKPPLIDGRFDYTAYQLGPREVGGGIQFPAVHGAVNGGTSAGIVGAIYNAAMDRDGSTGRLVNSFATNVRYVSSNAHPYGGNDDVSFKYTKCQVNTLEMSVSQSDVLNVNVDLIGVDRVPVGKQDIVYPTRNTRIVTWNDVVAAFHIVEPSSNRVGMVTGQVLRNFSLTINNGVERFYTLNNKLVPEDVTATKREITGSATALGRIFNTSELARTNEQRCAEFSQVIFGFRAAGSGSFIVDQQGGANPYSGGACDGSSSGDGTFTDDNTGVTYNTCAYDCSGGFFVYFPGVVFEIETLGLSTDIFETEFNFHILPGAEQAVGFNNEAGFLLGSGGSIDTDTFRYTGTVPPSWFANLSGDPPIAS